MVLDNRLNFKPELSPGTARKCSRIIQKHPIDFFSTLWYSVLSTQRF